MSFLISCFACVVMSQAAATPQWSSPLADYRRFDAEAPSIAWRTANQEVLAAGGHVGLMKSMAPAKGAAPAQPDGAAKPDSPPPGKAPAPAPKGGHDHGGHK